MANQPLCRNRRGIFSVPAESPGLLPPSTRAQLQLELLLPAGTEVDKLHFIAFSIGADRAFELGRPSSCYSVHTGNHIILVNPAFLGRGSLDYPENLHPSLRIPCLDSEIPGPGRSIFVIDARHRDALLGRAKDHVQEEIRHDQLAADVIEALLFLVVRKTAGRLDRGVLGPAIAIVVKERGDDGRMKIRVPEIEEVAQGIAQLEFVHPADNGLPPGTAEPGIGDSERRGHLPDNRRDLCLCRLCLRLLRGHLAKIQLVQDALPQFQSVEIAEIRPQLVEPVVPLLLIRPMAAEAIFLQEGVKGRMGNAQRRTIFGVPGFAIGSPPGCGFTVPRRHAGKEQPSEEKDLDALSPIFSSSQAFVTSRDHGCFGPECSRVPAPWRRRHSRPTRSPAHAGYRCCWRSGQSPGRNSAEWRAAGWRPGCACPSRREVPGALRA